MYRKCQFLGPLIVEAKGVEVMNADPTRATILYAKIEELNNGNRLQALCDGIMEDMKICGFIKPSVVEKRVLIHMTIMKTSGYDVDSPGRETFDATWLLKV